MPRGKAKRIANVTMVDEKYIGTEPIWDTERALKLSDEEFSHHMTRSFRYYNHFYTNKVLKKHVVKWLVANKKLNKSQLALYQQSEDWRTPMTVCSLVKAHEKGMPLKEDAVDYIMRKVMAAVESKAPAAKAEKKNVARKLSVQDYLKMQLDEYILHFEMLEDQQLAGEDVKANAYQYLSEKGVPQALVNKIANVFEARKSEIESAKNGDDDQLKEGYSNYKPKDFKRLIAFYDELLADLDRYAHTKKLTRKARVRKAPNKEKQVSKMRYKKDDAKLKLHSINPIDILDASVLWVYNIKTRKLGSYVADVTAGTLGVRGSTILGYDPSKSTCKTLRKPEQQLAEFLKAGKVQLRKFLTDIKAVETPLSGRINNDTILLKVQ